MRLALMSDIHGNREALEACLDHAAQSGVERYVYLGDYAGYGADPGWVIDTVQAHVGRGALAVLGNHDAAVLTDSEDMNETAAAAMAWTRTQLDDRQRAFLAGLPLTIEEKDRLYVHASGFEPDEWHYVTELYAAAKSLMATRAHATFCGHTHVPALFHMSMTGKFASFDPVDRVDIPLTRQRRWLAVIGSVGQPRDRDPAACYALLDDERDLLTYVRVPYDIESAARKIRAAGLPLSLSARLFEGY
ncbi:MAG TPA: metallophosphoesterase family protein [Xanthobacteraceae bacterium]|jgi:diadenosine tetraphosphatase ApaH/serine/threonine PP2A family protein phosphatase|nr:metallophosphoesterase family protein [Xanthobacteraceae bacterium]